MKNRFLRFYYKLFLRRVEVKFIDNYRTLALARRFGRFKLYVHRKR